MPRTMTLEIFLKASTSPLSPATKEAQRYRVGDIFAAHITAKLCNKVGTDWRVGHGGIGTEVMGYCHLTGIPDGNANAMNRVLAVDTGEVRTWRELDEHSPDYGEMKTKPDPWRLCKWHVALSSLPAPMHAALMKDREITVAWAMFQQYIRKCVPSDRFSPETDNRSEAVLAAELV